MTLTTLNTKDELSKRVFRPSLSQTEDGDTRELVDAIAPAPPASPNTRAIDLAATPPAQSCPPRQPLPTPVLYPDRPSLKLGLDVHLEFIMAVAQRDHAAAQAPRKFIPEQLILQVQKWVAEGLVVYAVAESCGFGFVLHHQLVAAGAQSFLVTPIALNGKRKTDKLDARALCVRLSRLVGSIDRMGNGRVRCLLVEAVWRFFQWQPGWKAAQRMRIKLGAGSGMKKKTVIALARQLAIDLWRWRTGRCTMADLGWVAV